jgi:hypothetical protein
MVAETIHLRGLSFQGLTSLPHTGGPTIVGRIDPEFIEAIFAELATPEGRIKLASTLAQETDDTNSLLLYQPVHRVFYIALFELVCDPFGASAIQPRLDPQKIIDAGLVIRRFATPPLDYVSSQLNRADSRHVVNKSRTFAIEGWRHSSTTLRGWLPYATNADERLDPDPARRTPELSSGVPEIDRLLEQVGATEPLTESFTPLFVAPADVCEKAGKTILYGFIPLASSESSTIQMETKSKVPSLSILSIEEGRYATPERHYVLRSFAHVAHDDGCPPALIWSDYSAPFVIAPWYASGPAPLQRIDLPNVLSANAIKKLKPNVAFNVPPELQNLLNGLNAKDLVEGNGSAGSGNITIKWICSFSIPIITICAFIVLNIFLQLLNIIFQWMAFIKICIPIPSRPPPP